MPNITREQLIADVIAYAQKHTKKLDIPFVTQFIKAYYQYAPLSDLQKRSLKDLYGAMRSHLNLMRTRKPGEYKRIIFNPKLETDGWESSHTVLMLTLDNQPFLVDSLSSAINRQGLAVHFLIHLGGIKVARDANHHLSRLVPDNHFNECEVLTEAPIYMEIDKLSDPDALATLEASIDTVIKDARLAARDWRNMADQIRLISADMEKRKIPISDQSLKEVRAFLEWILQGHFTFLGFRYYERTGSGKNMSLRLLKKTALGVLRDTKKSKLLRYYKDLPPTARELSLSSYPLILAKTNTRSTVHGGRYTDYIGIKHYDDAGNIVGEYWFIGLYTASIYTEDPKNFPLIREKFSRILKRSQLPENGHAYKALTHILKTLPRDDLFHATTDELFALSIAILEMQDRRCIRLFSRKGIFNRFLSCLVYLPSDDFDMEICYRIEAILKKYIDALEISYTTAFSAAILTCIHFTIRIDPRKTHDYDFQAIEQAIIKIGRSWKDDLKQALINHFGEEKGTTLAIRYKRAFSAAYKENFQPKLAVKDITFLEQLHGKTTLKATVYKAQHTQKHTFFCKLYHKYNTMPLSDVVPIFENMGLSTLSEQSYCVSYPDGSTISINEFILKTHKESHSDLEKLGDVFLDALDAIWHDRVENGVLNTLVLTAGLTWRKIALLCAYTQYMKQIGITFSQHYIKQAINNNPEIAQLLVKLFLLRFDPNQKDLESEPHQRIAAGDPIDKQCNKLISRIQKLLISVPNLDEDRILHIFLNLILATVRTNYFQTRSDNTYKPYISLKFDPSKIDKLPLPRPKHEVFVYATAFEGLHLRMNDVARGGIRISDRFVEDLRREVLGLTKAQQVKNAIIVPAGAKGGFVAKCHVAGMSKDQYRTKLVHCYQNFIRGLLDITDNLHQGAVVHPKDTLCWDAYDPYLVVAADKGTASFSDIANQISKEYQYWLGDAFASGGSTGYDHKKIGITARGGWESVKYHFQRKGIDVQKEPFTVIGIGDMSGDVFGNAMLLSDQIKLVAAFNGTHIFLDPDPDPKSSFKERQRLFGLPRSSWDSYDPDLISKGGGVYKRTLKAIELSCEARSLLATRKHHLTPCEVIRAILQSKVDLLWNGGIGTFVKSEGELDSDIGDRTNDAVRIHAKELGCSVVAEGGNLGLTQLARIAYTQNGGAINTDFIDNSGGVNCSDHEVNLKIFLNDYVARNQMTEAERNALLARMQDQVAQLVLQDNRRQTKVVGLAAQLSVDHLNLFQNHLNEMVKQGKIDRDLEFLPSDETFAARKSAHLGLTCPEVAILLAYAKIILKSEIMESELVDDPYLFHYIDQAFPSILRESDFQKDFKKHRLAKEILATQLSNTLINDIGTNYVYQMQYETHDTIANIVRAYVIASELFGLRSALNKIDTLSVPFQLQNEMTLEVMRLIRRSARWLLHNYPGKLSIAAMRQLFLEDIRRLGGAQLARALCPSDKLAIQKKKDKWLAAGIPVALADQIANAQTTYALLNIIKMSRKLNAKVLDIAHIYFAVVKSVQLDVLHDKINEYPSDTHWMLFARATAKKDISYAKRVFTRSIYTFNQQHNISDSSITLWLSTHQTDIDSWLCTVKEMQSTQNPDFAVLISVMAKLSKLVESTRCV